MLAPSPPQPSIIKRMLDVLNPRPPAAKLYQPMGIGGTAIFGGYVQSREKSSQWTGQQRYVTIADMAVNTSIVAAGVHYFLNLIARPTWTIGPSDESSGAKAAAEFIDDCLQDLAQPWSRVVRRAGTYRFYGFGIQEWTAKRRLDGKVGLASVDPRPQATIHRWSVSDSGAVEGVWQVSTQTGQEFGIPRKKLFYLVDDVLSDSPEGVGIFRHLAEPWERLKQYYALEARAFERDLRGTPVGRVPYTLLREAVANNDLTEVQAKDFIKAVEDFVKLQVKQSDTAITLDSIPYYSQAADGAKVAGLPQWGLELLQGGSAGMAEVAAAITRTQTEMARLLTVEHLMMGESSGNRALSEDKSKNLYLLANAVLQDIAAGVQQDIVPVICDLNGIPEELYPQCMVEDVSSADADAVATILAKMAQAGAVLAPDDPVIDDVRSLMGVSESKPSSPEMMGLSTSGAAIDAAVAGAGGGVGAGVIDLAAADAAAAVVKGCVGEGVVITNRGLFKYNENHDELGRFPEGVGSTDSSAQGHKNWVQQFEAWSVRNAFGPTTVNAGAVRAHMHANNVEVQQAAMKVAELHKEVGKYFTALPYQPTPLELDQAYSAVKAHLRAVENAARAAAKIGRFAKENPNHVPAGTPEGGQFMSGNEGVGNVYSLSEAGATAAQSYQAGGSDVINAYVSGRDITADDYMPRTLKDKAAVIEAAKGLKSAINQAPLLQNTTVYRGISNGDLFKVGKVMTYPHFVSTSHSISIAKERGVIAWMRDHHELEKTMNDDAYTKLAESSAWTMSIKASGVKALDVDKGLSSAGKSNAFANEKEVIFAPGTKLRVSKVSRKMRQITAMVLI